MLYLILAIFIVTSIGTLYLLMQMRRDKQHVHIGNIENNIDMTQLTAWLDANYTPKRSADEEMAIVYQELRSFTEEMRQTLTNMQQRIHEEGKLTRKETQEIKTRLADEESDDQDKKRAAHRKKAKA